MKRILMMFCLALFVSVQNQASDVYASPAKNTGCYPITSFDTAEKAVSKFKELTEGKEPLPSSNPVLLPTWLPYEATLGSIRIVGCGTTLKAEYINNKKMIRVHVTPQIKNSKFVGSDIVTLKDGTKSIYKETQLSYMLRFDKEGRTYMILIDKKNGALEKISAIEYLYKIANSLAPVK